MLNRSIFGDSLVYSVFILFWRRLLPRNSSFKHSDSWQRLFIVSKSIQISLLCVHARESSLPYVLLEKKQSQIPGFPGGSDSKVSTCIERDVGSIPGLEDPLEKDMATHPNILAWEIPWTEEPDGLQSMESQRVGHGSVTKQQPQIPLFLWSLTFLSVTKTQKNQA